MNDAAAWSHMREALWPDAMDEHARAIADYFAGAATFIDHVIVCEDDDATVVGFVELRVRNYAEGSENPAVPYVEGWFVDEVTRGRGIGRLLIEGAQAWAKDQGFTELASDAELDNGASIAAHRALGFDEVERSVSFLKHLS